MIGCFNRSVLLTYLGIIFSLSGIGILLMGCGTDLAVICLILAGICDLFDGFVARKCKRNETQKRFGEQIDSLADVISFLIFPSVLLFYLTGKGGIVCLAVDAFYVLCGVNRLAWFNIKIETFRNAYEGLPVTYSALLISLLYVLSGFLPLPWFVMPILYGLIGLLFILKIKIPKPRGILYPFFGILAIALIVLILL